MFVTCRISSYLGIQCLFDADSSLDLCLSSLDLCHDALDVLELVTPLPEDRRVLHYLLRCLPFNLLGDSFDVIPATLLVSLDELVEVTLTPIGEALQDDCNAFKLFVTNQSHWSDIQHSPLQYKIVREPAFLPE